MVDLDRLTGIRLSELKNCQIICADGEKIGRLIDAVFKPSDKGLELTKFVVGGSRLEELLEALRLKPDVDPVFSVDVIKSVSPQRITLKVPKNELKSTHLHKDAIEEDEIKLSHLGRLKVYDESKENIGSIIDMTFSEGSFQLILGDSKVIEWAESLGLMADVDFLISPSYIKSVSKDGIVLNKNKDELKSTFEEHLKEEKDKMLVKGEILKTQASASIYFPRM